MNLDKEFMKQALKRVDELKQETIEKSKQIPNSEAYVREKLRTSGIVSYSKCKKCKKVMLISELEINPGDVGRICIEKEACELRQ